MKLHKINVGDNTKIAGGSFTLAEIKLIANALTLDIEGDMMAEMEANEGKKKLLVKLNALIDAWA